jgi:hypothetical protein
MRQLVVAKVRCPRREPSRPFDLGRERHVPLADAESEELEGLGARERNPSSTSSDLQHLLDGLLGVEANDLIGYLRVTGKLTDGNRICLRLSR